jgi:hypothetical protein
MTANDALAPAPDLAPPPPPADDPPPFLGRWRNVYLALALTEATIIALLALLTVLASGCAR